MFFEAEARKLMRNGGGARPVEVPASDPNLSEVEWFEALKCFLLVGAWLRADWGPAPTEANCKAPTEMLGKARVVWEQQCNHPRDMPDGNRMIAWEPRNKRSLIKDPVPFYRAAA
jgi:hypothetical protein